MNFGRSGYRTVGSWLGVASVLGIFAFAALGTEGCTVTTGSGLDDGGLDFDTGTDGGSDSSKPDTGTDTGAADTGAPDTSVPVNACNECLAGSQACAAQIAVCWADSECTSIYACTTAAGCDNTCQTNCLNAGTDKGRNKYLALGACDVYYECTSCQTQCTPSAQQCTPPDAGADTGAADASTPATCDQCQADSCSLEKSKCGDGSDCKAYLDCVISCSGDACNACATQHAQGKTDSDAFGTCTQTNCASQCFPH